jgi:D-alanyl-D-alanine carboxypeptidase (penicillin-binding protein 5/6)
MRAVFWIAFLLALPAFAFAAPRQGRHQRAKPAPVAEQQTPAAPQDLSDPNTTIQTPAQFAVVMDFDTGAVLFSKGGDDLMKPASMAKLMTVAILFERLKNKDIKLDDTFLVSEKAWRQSIAEKSQASKMFVQVGDSIRVEDLVRGIVIQSGNDACIVVAEHIGGSEEGFARLMNAEAKRIGLTRSVFANSSGLPDPAQNVTAHEMALIARYIIREFPDYYHYFSEKDFTWSKITQPNRNLLLGVYPGADGLKTGHTAESGYGMTASATQDGRRLIVVVNGLKSENERLAEVKRLFDIGFREFKTYALFKPGDVVAEAEVWAGESQSVPLTVRAPVKTMLRRSSRPGLKVTLKYNEPIISPIQRGQQLGSLLITAPGAPDMTVPVFAATAVDSGGLFTQMKVGLTALMTGSETPRAAGDSEGSAETPAPPDTSQ